MSGHSKWNNIAKRKGANDAKKAKIFTKIGREMAIAIKEGGSANPDFNSRLRDCIAKAKANNMPNDNIKRTLDKYSGANGQVDYEANNYEGYGVGGVAVVVETLTDNKNRSPPVRQVRCRSGRFRLRILAVRQEGRYHHGEGRPRRGHRHDAGARRRRRGLPG